MALLNSFEKSGNVLFKYRGQIPVALFLMAVPVIMFTEVSNLSQSMRCVLSISSIVISILGFLFRAYAIGTTPKGTSGRNTQEQVAESLNTKGIYSIVRHPLYVGNFFMWIGIVMFTFNIYFVVIVSLMFWLYYERIMFAEERFLERKFGESYMQWAAGVPAFIPSMKIFKSSDIPFSLKTVLRREYSGVLATVLGFAFVDYLRAFIVEGATEWHRPTACVFGATLILALILRSLKHYTKFLNDETRS